MSVEQEGTSLVHFQAPHHPLRKVYLLHEDRLSVFDEWMSLQSYRVVSNNNSRGYKQHHKTHGMNQLKSNNQVDN